MPNKRSNWVMRQYVSMGQDIAKEEGLQAGAMYMCSRGVPIDVALRTLWGVTRPMGSAV